MIRKYLPALLFTAFFFIRPSSGQHWDLKTITGQGLKTSSAIVKDEAGNVYVAGTFSDTLKIENQTFVTRGNYDGYIAAYSRSGAAKWIRTFGGNSADYLYDAVYKNGILYFGGAFLSTSINFVSDTLYNPDGSGGYTDSYIAAMDTSGNFIRAKSFGSAGSYNDQIADIEVTENAIYTAGTFEGAFNAGNNVVGGSSGLTDAFFLKMDLNFNTRWGRFANGSKSDYGTAIATDAYGNIYAAGSFGNSSGLGSFSVYIGNAQLSASGGFGFTDIFLAKFDTAGLFQYAIRDGGGNPDYTRKLISSGTKILLAGNYYYNTNLGGDIYTTNGGYEGFIAAYDTALSHIWSQPFAYSEGSTQTDDNVLGLDKDDAGNSYLLMQHSPLKYTLYFIGSNGAKLSSADVITQCNSSYSGGLFVDGNCNSVYLTASFINQVAAPTDTLNGNYGDVFWAARSDSANFLQAPSGISANSPDSICANAPTFSVKVNAVPGAAQYSWQLIPKQAGIISGIDSSALVNIDSTYYGNLKIICRASSGCSVSEASDTSRIYIRAVPQTPFITLNGYQLNTTAIAQTYNWYNGNALAGSTSVNYFGASTGGYYVLRTENEGCISEASNGIFVVITDSDRGSKESQVRIGSDEAGNFRLINFSREEVISAEITELFGRKLFVSDNSDSLELWMNQALAPSVYVLRWRDANGRTSAIRFVKR